MQRLKPPAKLVFIRDCQDQDIAERLLRGLLQLESSHSLQIEAEKAPKLQTVYRRRYLLDEEKEQNRTQIAEPSCGKGWK